MKGISDLKGEEEGTKREKTNQGQVWKGRGKKEKKRINTDVALYVYCHQVLDED